MQTLAGSSRLVVKPEIHFDVERYGYRTAILCCRREPPSSYRCNRIIVQAHPEGVGDVDVSYFPGRINHHIKSNDALQVAIARCIGISRLWRVLGLRRLQVVIPKAEN